MRRVVAILALLLCAGRATAQDVPLTVEPSKVIKVDRTVIVSTDVLTANKFPFKVTAPAGGALYRWQYPTGVVAVARAGVLEISAAPAGEITFAVEYVVVDFDKKKLEERFGRVSVLVGDAPKPPDPKPPGPVTGIRVLILEESADRAKLPKAQYNVLFDKSVREWLDANCRALDAKTKEWGIQDKDTDLSGYSKELEAMRNRPRTSLPWIVIDSDRGVLFEGPLPPDIPGTLNLLGKFTPVKLRKAG